MITVRAAADRGYADHGWLRSFHTFSFADFYDPRHMGFRALRVINEDSVAPGQGFGTHGHRDMEILSWVLEGALEHKDSLGSGAVLKPGEAQRMTAGTGVRHSEFNASKSEHVHFLQIWLLPTKDGLTPSYEQKFFPPEERKARLKLIASPEGDDGSVRINADARVFNTLLEAGQRVEHTLTKGRHAWVQIARGSFTVNGREVRAGDGVAISDETLVTIDGREDGSEALLFDLG
ncbi:MAG: pirin family protein [Archangium sp.]|nr:pirin family protein [Archangium sp.]